jgi:transcriptional regulator with XRE-family HTH domain
MQKFYDDLSEFIKRKMEERGYNIKRLAEELKVSSSTVSRWLTYKITQKTIPSKMMLIKIARVLELDSNETQKLFDLANVLQPPQFYGLFPPEKEFLEFLCKDGDRNLYEDRIREAEFCYYLIINSLEEYFKPNKKIPNVYVDAYLHAYYGLAHVYIVYKEWNKLKKILEKTKIYINKKDFPYYYFQNRYLCLLLHFINNKRISKFDSLIENLEKDIIKYYHLEKELPLYIHSKEILLCNVKKYKALYLGPSLESEKILNLTIEELTKIDSIGTKISHLITLGKLISEKDFKRGIIIIENAFDFLMKKQREFEKIGAWSERNKKLISNLPLLNLILLTFADLYLKSGDILTAKYFAKESFKISNKIGLIEDREFAEGILNLR